MRKRVTVVNGLGEVVVVHDATVDDVGLQQGAFPAKAQNPVFLDGQVFWGMEWPIAEAAVRDGRFRLTHFPAAAVAPGGSWTSKTTGFGVSASDRIEEAFGRYIQVIRANRVDFATFYFDWLCHDNSGPLESEILANFAALKRLREMYGLQFDIYNSDAGLVESQGTYFPQFKARFDQRFPNGLRPIADASSRLGMKLGLWIGPDGFGETPASMAARRNQLLAWVKDFNVGLFKMDTVVSALAHEDKYILEKKYQSLADALAEARRLDPSFVAINHRINDSPYMLTITDCLLWKGEETYIDVHIANTTAALYNRSASIGRELTSEFFKTPFRQFEDHGICFNSSVEKWADDLVAQAFGRASVLSPELYGTFFFLPDEDYPRLARLIQLHKRSQSMLKQAFPLADGDIAHGDGRSSLLVLRNPTWGYQTKVVPLDGTHRPGRGPRRSTHHPAAPPARVPHLEPGDQSRGVPAGRTGALRGPDDPGRRRSSGRTVSRWRSVRDRPGPECGIVRHQAAGRAGPACRDLVPQLRRKVGRVGRPGRERGRRAALADSLSGPASRREAVLAGRGISSTRRPAGLTAPTWPSSRNSRWTTMRSRSGRWMPWHVPPRPCRRSKPAGTTCGARSSRPRGAPATRSTTTPRPAGATATPGAASSQEAPRPTGATRHCGGSILAGSQT